MCECERVNVGGTTMLVMRGGAEYTLDGRRFEWSDRFGPGFVGKRGQEVSGPSPRDHFWKALDWWIQQGKQVDADGNCIYTEPRPQRRAHIVGKHWLDVPDHWTEEQVQAKITHLLTLAHKRIERRQQKGRR